MLGLPTKNKFALRRRWEKKNFYYVWTIGGGGTRRVRMRITPLVPQEATISPVRRIAKDFWISDLRSAKPEAGKGGDSYTGDRVQDTGVRYGSREDK